MHLQRHFLFLSNSRLPSRRRMVRLSGWLGRAVLLALLITSVGATAWWRWPRVPQPAALPTFASRPAAELAADGRFRGVSWVAADSAASTDLTSLLHDHVTWIAQTPFGWQAGAAVPTVQLHTQRPPGRHGYWGESDYGLTQTALQARRQGIHTLLKPHLWLRGNGGTWPGDIEMQSAADWQAWFASYSAFILHYAKLAEEQQLEALCIGTELEKTVRHEAEWRALIGQVRQVYHGPLTYAANWSGEFEQIQFWDALDFIGIQAYFPLSKSNSPAKAELLASWQTHLAAIQRVQKRFKKPVVFTEAGYKNTPDAAVEPWKWPDRTAAFTAPDEATQAACYEALFETFWPRPWFKGLFVWKWYPGLAADGPARRHADFTPQHKPAEQVMASWYGK